MNLSKKSVCTTLLILCAMGFGPPTHAATSSDPKAPIIRCAGAFGEIAAKLDDSPEAVRRRAMLERVQRTFIKVQPSKETLATQYVDFERITERVDLSEVADLKTYPHAIGLGFLEALEGTYQGSRVFIKVSPILVGRMKGRGRTLEHLRNEAVWAKRLHELGIGPRFYGLTKRDNRHAVVTEFVDGIHVSPMEAGTPFLNLPDDFVPTEELIKNLEHIDSVFRSEGIHAKDLQLRMTSTRAFVIDPELFEPAFSVVPLDDTSGFMRGLIAELRKRMAEREATAR